MSRRFFLVVRGDLNFSCTTRNKIKSSNKMLSERWWLICRWRIFVVFNLTLKLVSILSSCGFTRHHSMFIHNVKLWPKIINRERERETHMRVIFIIINWLRCLSQLDISIGHTSLDSFLLFFVLLCNRFPHLLINVWLPIVALAASSRHNGYAKNVTSSIFD